MAPSRDSAFLQRAGELAAEGRFRVEPNPLVGCVLVKGGRVVGEGHHAYWGGPHAEVNAIRAAGGKARGATAYVTLEPCAHHGKTPPCADALVRAGVKEVVYALADPNPATAGEGPKRLRAAGVAVRKARPPARVTELTRPYFTRDRNRPWVIAKWAMTVDGRIATRKGDSKWVSSERSRLWSHKTFRGRVDAIVVGAGTVRADNPSLTNRSGRGRQPLRVAVCGRRPLPRKAKLLTDGGKTLVAMPLNFPAPDNVETIVCGAKHRVSAARLLKYLHKRGVRRVLLEGGGDLLGHFFDRGYVDQVCVFVAPRIVGGISAVSPVAGRGRPAMGDAWTLATPTHQAIDGDHVIEAYTVR